MAYEFYLRHLDRLGNVKQANLNPLNFYLVVKKYGGSLRFEIDGDNEVTDTFVDYDYVELWWRNLRLGIKDTSTPSGQGFVRLVRMIYRDQKDDTDNDSITIFEATCYSKWHILTLRQIYYQNETADRTEYLTAAVESIGKSIIKYNCTSDATIANGRWRDGDLAPGMFYDIAIATDEARGLVRDYRTGNGGKPRNGGVLKNLAELASNGLGDFTLSDSDTAGEYSLDFNLGQQGDDKFAEVIFSTTRRNIVIPSSWTTNAWSPTVAIAAGQGKAPDRITSDERTGPAYAADNDVELFIDARQLLLVDSLNDRADQELYEQRAQIVNTFTIVQTADTFLSNVDVDGRYTYFIGDAVNVTGLRQEIASFSIDWRNEVPDIQVLTENP